MSRAAAPMNVSNFTKLCLEGGPARIATVHVIKGGATELKVGGQNLCERSEQTNFSVDPPLLA